VTLPPGWVSRLCKSRPAVNSGSAQSRKWAIERYAAFSSSAEVLLSVMPADAAPRWEHGSRACWHASHGCWWRWHWPTRQLGSSGPCWQKAESTELRSRQRKLVRGRGGRRGVGRSEGAYGATVVRRDRENQFMSQRLERAVLIWTRSSNSHTGLRLDGRTQRPDRCQNTTYAPSHSSRFLLRPWGRPQMCHKAAPI
jgi:hypothetical protein